MGEPCAEAFHLITLIFSKLVYVGIEGSTMFRHFDNPISSVGHVSVEALGPFQGRTDRHLRFGTENVDSDKIIVFLDDYCDISRYTYLPIQNNGV
jgi:hypothetical protein